LSSTRKAEGIANDSHRGMLEVQVEKKPLQNVRALTGLTVVLFAFNHSNSNAKVGLMAGTGCVDSNVLELFLFIYQTKSAIRAAGIEEKLSAYQLYGWPSTDLTIPLVYSDCQWCGCLREGFSTLCRWLREGSLGPPAFDAAKKRTRDLFECAFEVVSLDKVKERALRLLQVQPLRAADALQLAAVRVVAEEIVARLSNYD